MGKDRALPMAAHHQPAPSVSRALIPSQAMLRAQIQYLACEDMSAPMKAFLGTWEFIILIFQILPS